MTTKQVVALILGVVLVGAAAYVGCESRTGGSDTPILVGDGSVILGSPVPFETWSTPDDSTIVHPKTSGKMAGIDVLGAQKDACPGNAPCTVKATWSNGITIEVSGGPNGSGLRIRSSVSVQKGWTKGSYLWTYPTDASISEIAVRKGNSPDWKSVCTGARCQVLIHYN